MILHLPTSRDECVAHDASDPLAPVARRFHKPEGIIYLDGNSLGPLPHAALGRFDEVIRREWGDGLITSWNRAGWFDLPSTLGDRLGKLIGAGPGQTVVCDTTSINIYKCLHAALSLKPGRKAIVVEEGGLPDRPLCARRRASGWPAESAFCGTAPIRSRTCSMSSVAAVLLAEVDYRTGALLDMRELTREIHDAGALAIWDLCHSAGVMPIALDDCGADFAIGCTYKYLNGGPGSPAFLYAARSHQEEARQPLSGWWGHARPFAFERDFRPDAGIKKFLCGTQPILSMAGVAAGLDAMEGADGSA